MVQKGKKRAESKRTKRIKRIKQIKRGGAFIKNKENMMDYMGYLVEKKSLKVDEATKERIKATLEEHQKEFIEFLIEKTDKSKEDIEEDLTFYDGTYKLDPVMDELSQEYIKYDDRAEFNITIEGDTKTFIFSRETLDNQTKNLGIDNTTEGICSIIKLFYHGIDNTIIHEINTQVIKQLKQMFPDKFSPENNLRNAIKQSNVNNIKQILHEYPNLINIKMEDGSTMLHKPAFLRNIEFFQMLLAIPGVKVNEKDNDGWTPLHSAAFNGNEPCVRLLLVAPGVNANEKNNDGSTPLHLATKYGREECVRLLLAVPGVQVNEKDNYGDTPLHLAAYMGREACLRLLLAAPGVNVNEKNKYGNTPLHEAASQGNEACVRRLLAVPGVNANEKNNDGSTPLHKAAYWGHEACVRRLLAVRRVNVNEKDNYGNTPLHDAAEKKHEACLRLLLAARGVEVNAKDRYENTPLHKAATSGSEACVRLLLAAPGVQVNEKNNDGWTPISLAQIHKYDNIIRLLNNPITIKEKSNILTKIFKRTPKGGSTTTMGGKIEKEYATYKDKKYVVRIGTKGGKYILVGTDKKKIYIK